MKRNTAGRYSTRVRAVGNRLRSMVSTLMQRRRPQTNVPQPNDLVARLEQATAGLLYPSETDALVEVFVYRDTAPFTPQTLLAATGHEQDTPIKTSDLDRFFRSVTTPQDWHEQPEKERMQRFIALRDLLTSELSDVQVYRIGSISIDVYVIGHAADGTYLGIKTKVVET